MLDSVTRKEKFPMFGGYIEITEVDLSITDKYLTLDLLHKFRCESVFEPSFSFAGSELGSSYRVKSIEVSYSFSFAGSEIGSSYRVKSIEVSYPFLATVTLVEVS